METPRTQEHSSLRNHTPTAMDVRDAMERIREQLFARNKEAAAAADTGNNANNGERERRNTYNEDEDKFFDDRIKTVDLIHAVQKEGKGWTCSKKFPIKLLREIDAQFSTLVGVPKFKGSRKSVLIAKLIMQRDFILTELKSIGLDMRHYMSCSRHHFRDHPVPVPDEPINLTSETNVAEVIAEEIQRPIDETASERDKEIDRELKTFKGKTIPELIAFLKKQIARACDYDNTLCIFLLNQEIDSYVIKNMLLTCSRQTLTVVEEAMRQLFAEDDDQRQHTGNIKAILELRERYFETM